MKLEQHDFIEHFWIDREGAIRRVVTHQAIAGPCRYCGSVLPALASPHTPTPSPKDSEREV